MLRRWPAVCAIVCGTLASLGCEAVPNLMVELRTDFVPGEEFARVRTVALLGDRVEREQEIPVTSARDFVSGWRVAELWELPPGQRRIRVELLDRTGRQLIDRSVIVEHRESRVITIVISRSCREVSCPSPTGDASATECLAGRCVPPECIDLDSCAEVECASASDCVFSADCATAVCERGVCLAADPGDCGPDAYCDPERGCLPRADVSSDAGLPRDAGGLDAGGADAGGECAAGCDDGLDCTADACEAGACVHTPDDARCTDGSAGTCVVGFGCQYAGCTPDTCVAGPCEVAHCAGDSCVIESACGATEECCGGSCVPAGCDDRDPCTDDACGGGAGCTHTPNTATCDDGVFCNGADTCGGGTCSTHAGDPCSGASVCDETSGSCVGCVGDADCPDPVAGSWGSCGYADVCAQTGTQERTVTSYRCMGGSCRATPSMESRACSRSTNGNSCGSTTFGTWGSCGGFSGTCDESGTR
ncbi:MAG: hypothetical protein KC619_11170, partial [Myxococcales bacterium]|nr:hypothetical protein [Myxococcales bacterium]